MYLDTKDFHGVQHLKSLFLIKTFINTIQQKKLQIEQKKARLEKGWHLAYQSQSNIW
jgi:hypothetical protein